MKLGRNDPCPCNSGKKYKKCCIDQGLNASALSNRSPGVSSSREPLNLQTPTISMIPNVNRDLFKAEASPRIKDKIKKLFDLNYLSIQAFILIDQFDNLSQKKLSRETFSNSFDIIRRNRPFFESKLGSIEPMNRDVLKRVFEARLTLIQWDFDRTHTVNQIEFNGEIKKYVSQQYLTYFDCSEDRKDHRTSGLGFDFMSKKVYDMPGLFIKESKPLDYMATFAYIIPHRDYDAALVVNSDVQLKEEVVRLLFDQKVIDNQNDIEAFYLEINSGKSPASLWFLTDLNLWMSLMRSTTLTLKSRGLRVTSKRIASIWIKETPSYESKVCALSKLFRTAFASPEPQMILKPLLEAWDYSRQILCSQQTQIPTSTEMMAAYIEHWGIKIESGFKTSKKRNSAQSKSYNHHRIRKSDFQNLKLTDAKIYGIGRALEMSMKKILEDRGLQPNCPQVTFDTKADRVHLEGGVLTLPTSFLEYEWEMLQNVIRWALASTLVGHYQEGNPTLSKDQAFDMACKRLCLAPEFIKKNLDSMPHHWKEEADSLDERQKGVLRKIDRLFALAESSNLAESTLAMEKAQNLLTEFNIERTSSPDFNSRDVSSIVKLTLYLNYKTHTSLDRAIVVLLQEFYFVKPVYSYYWSLDHLEYYASVDLIGEKQNVLMAEYVFDFLVHKVDRLWEEAHKGGIKSSHRLSYQVGILNGFHKKMASIEKERRQGASSTNQLNGLIALTKDKIDAYLNNLYPSLKSSTTRQKSWDAESFNQGASEGAKLQIQRPIENASASSSEPFLIT